VGGGRQRHFVRFEGRHHAALAAALKANPGKRHIVTSSVAHSSSSWRSVARMSFVIYLDHNATTPILPDVLEVTMPYLTTEWAES
jgi:hypothetical protein